MKYRPGGVTETSEPDIYADLPTGDYGGEEFTILNSIFSYAEARLDTESLSGDVLNDALYHRTREVEDRLNVDINVIDQDYWSENPVSYITNIVMSGEDSVDACFIGVQKNVTAITNGIYADLNDISELDFNKPWWDSNTRKYYEIDGKLYTALGEASMNIHDSLWALFFNKDILENSGLEDPYALVRDGKWTLDKMYSLVEAAGNDIDGDGTLGAGDQWGLMTHNGSAFAFLHGAGCRGVDMENGVPYVCDIDDKMVSAYEKIRTLFSAKATMTDDKMSGKLGYTCTEGFQNNHGLFLAEVFGHAAKLRAMDTDFGIIPYPKLDENQKEYVAYYSPATNGFCVPKTAKDYSRTGTVIEVMSALGYRDVRPVYYDVVLTGKTARDNESVEMLDIIFSNIESELAYIYQWGGYSETIKNVATGTKDIVSTLTSKKEATEKAIDKFIDSLQ